MSTLAAAIDHCTESSSQNYEAGGKNMQIREAEVKLPLFIDDMILYIENLKISTKKTQNEFLYTSNEQSKVKKTILLTIA